MIGGVLLGLFLVVVAGRKPAGPPGPPADPPGPAPAPPPPPGPKVPAPIPAPDGLPPDADPGQWVQLVDEPGLEVRTPSRAWTTAAARAVIRQAAAAALALGGKLHVADAGEAPGPDGGPGTEYPPHKSHRWGRDFDIGYTLEAYPTPAGVAVDPRVPAILESITPWIDRVGVNEVRKDAFAGRPYKISVWSGHVGHAHLRLVKGVTTEP